MRTPLSKYAKPVPFEMDQIGECIVRRLVPKLAYIDYLHDLYGVFVNSRGDAWPAFLILSQVESVGAKNARSGLS